MSGSQRSGPTVRRAAATAIAVAAASLTVVAKSRVYVPGGRGVRLTPAAVGLVGHVEVVLSELERAEADIAAA